MSAKIIDGKALAKKICDRVATEAAEIFRVNGVAPKLAVVFAGEDPASAVYVRNKEIACREAGILSIVHRLPSKIKQEELEALIYDLNRDPAVHGILLQLPLPESIDENKVINSILPDKDVDGLHPINLGKLLIGDHSVLIPCTPQGIIELILSTGCPISGRQAVVVGRSRLVGKPVALLLLQGDATVTICHSKTAALAEVIQRAEILVAAVGQPGLIRGDMVREGAVVIDVGINRGKEGLLGDVDFAGVQARAGYITPVPGGVGPMTIAMLLKNTLKAAATALKVGADR